MFQISQPQNLFKTVHQPLNHSLSAFRRILIRDVLITIMLFQLFKYPKRIEQTLTGRETAVRVDYNFLNWIECVENSKWWWWRSIWQHRKSTNFSIFREGRNEHNLSCESCKMSRVNFLFAWAQLILHRRVAQTELYYETECSVNYTTHFTLLKTQKIAFV